jgi:2-octaprenyl-6-methoxyphenol hydroxylase
MSTDILVAGGGPVGLVLAVALRQAAPDLAVTIVERSEAVAGDDGRASAISAAAKDMLETLGVWQGVESVAQPIGEMVVTDSRSDDVVRPVFLTFGGALDDGEPFAHMVPNEALRSQLADAASAAGVDWLRPETVSDFAVDQVKVTATLGSGGRLAARVLIAADGVKSRLRGIAGIKTIGWDYRQTGLVATIAHERPHNGRAEEHFLPAGPFAMLPLRGNRSSLVWTEKPDIAARILAAAKPELNQELVKRLGEHLGEVAIEGRLQSYALSLRLARDFVKPRFGLVGDAAHAIHPLAGQGLNLGLRDAAALAESVVEAHRLGLDVGAADVLERYQAWRRFDVAEMAALTDGLNRLFANDNPIIRIARDIGLGVVNRLPAMKRLMMKEAAGRSGDLPRLLKGEPI